MNSLPFPSMIADGPRRIAVVMSNAIGDTLVLMVIVQNLLRNGIDVTVFGLPAHALRHWFPEVAIQPLPDDADAKAMLAPYDTVLQMHRNQPMPRLTEAHACVIDLDKVVFGDRSGCMAERFADFCRGELGLSNVGLYNGMTPPPALRHRQHIRRIAIHPRPARRTSAGYRNDSLNWPKICVDAVMTSTS